MNQTTKKINALIVSVILTVGAFSICPSIMYVQWEQMKEHVAELNSKNLQVKNTVRTLAVLERN